MSHLLIYGIDSTYTCWTRYRDTISRWFEHIESCASPDFNTSTFDTNHLDNMVKALQEDIQGSPKMIEILKDVAMKPLYGSALSLPY